MWNPSKKEIQEWVEQKEWEFAEEENRSPCLSTERWLEKYIFKDQYEIFFGSFHVELYEWISRLNERNNYFKGDEPKECIAELIQRLKKIDNRISRIVDLWIDRILGGFITKFTVDSIVPYSEAE